ncbi:hypothetical protein [Roseivivax marinus]|uniref:hypothetical protein n=1 Tax=Roseivivax marinus TaxID=1379903 RepID=UPI000B891E4E|nr:hypothetical protein [Roseivivax marinus]
MSISDEKIVEWRELIQHRVDERTADGSDREFNIADLFTKDEWETISENGRYGPALSNAFAQRLPGAEGIEKQPLFARVMSRWVLGESDGQTPPYFARTEI